MEIDNKTRATVLREFAQRWRECEYIKVELISEEAEELDPPEKPIHPHEEVE